MTIYLEIMLLTALLTLWHHWHACLHCCQITVLALSIVEMISRHHICAIDQLLSVFILLNWFLEVLCRQCSRIRILRFFQISKNMTFYVF